ncbi:MAG: hypothetical protein ABI873_20135 [Marmoricola sp.]
MLVLAVDMPRVSEATVERLRAAALGDGAVLVDGRRQHLCAAYRTRALLNAAPRPEDEHGLPMHRLVGDLQLVEGSATRLATSTPGATCTNSRISRRVPLAPVPSYSAGLTREPA